MYSVFRALDDFGISNNLLLFAATKGSNPWKSETALLVPPSCLPHNKIWTYRPTNLQCQPEIYDPRIVGPRGQKLLLHKRWPLVLEMIKKNAPHTKSYHEKSNSAIATSLTAGVQELAASSQQKTHDAKQKESQNPFQRSWQGPGPPSRQSERHAGSLPQNRTGSNRNTANIHSGT